MKIDPRSLVAPLVGIMVLVLVVQSTMGALRASGAWQASARTRVQPENPYANLDAMLSQPPSDPVPAAVRDPFGFGSSGTPAARSTAPRPKKPTTVTPASAPAPVPEQPTLTAIIWDQDPRATVRWEGRDISVRENTLFADFTVKSIRPTEVVLERDGQQVVLTLAKKGDQP